MGQYSGCKLINISSFFPGVRLVFMGAKIVFHFGTKYQMVHLLKVWLNKLVLSLPLNIDSVLAVLTSYVEENKRDAFENWHVCSEKICPAFEAMTWRAL